MDIALPLSPLLAAVAVLAAINGVSLLLLRRRRAVTNAELTAALLFDVAALAWQLHHSGGLTNPLASLFLLQFVIGPILLPPQSPWAIAPATPAGLAALRVEPAPRPLPARSAAASFTHHLKGSLAL